MRRFEHREHREAVAHAATGEQALHVWEPGADAGQRFPDAPAVFKRRSKVWGHLFDQDAERLAKTARRLGVREVVIDRRGDPGQHVDLCGGPLERAIAGCAKPELVSLGLLLLLVLVVALAGCGAEGDAIYCYGPDAAEPATPCAEASAECIAEAEQTLTAEAKRMGDAAALVRYSLRVEGCLDEFDRCAYEAALDRSGHE